MSTEGSAFWVVALMAAGIGGIFLWTDWNNRPSRALALCLLMIGLRLALAPVVRAPGESGFWAYQIACRIVETASILAGIDWGRRIALDASRWRRTVSVLFRVSQGIALLYGIGIIVYLFVAPDDASREAAGFVRMHGWGWLFIPVLAVAVLLSAIALTFVLFTRNDPVESVRVRALIFAAPFLLGALVLGLKWIPLAISVGLLIFLWGSVRYLIVQGQRAQSMKQFVSPEVARMLSVKGMAETMKRERRQLSVVICDLRGFTAYAGDQDSDEVVGMLERYYRVVGKVAAEYRGTVKDHAGDGVLILVGAPLPDRKHAQHAVKLALALSERVSTMLEGARVPLGIGVGVASGPTTIGALRGAGRLEYAAVGTAVNLAARLCQRAGDGIVLIDETTRAALGEDPAWLIDKQPPEPFKGFAEPVPVYALSTAPVPMLAAARPR